MIKAISLKDISFSYSEDREILCVPNLEVNQGEKVFVHGARGSGKSTLLNIISGILTPQAGESKVLGVEIDKLSMRKRDQFRGDNIGFIFQQFNLISYLTIYENILLALKASKKKRKRVEKQVDSEILRISEHLGISLLLDKRVTDLSVGQQQRVAVARALIGGPEIIIADEPTSSLDNEITQNFMKLLIDEQRRKNFTLVFVSHDKSLSTFFDREISLAEINQAGEQHA